MNTVSHASSKQHIWIVAILISLAFTYAGVDESLVVCLTELDFLLNLVINTCFGLFYFHISHTLHFKKRFPLQKAVIIVLSAFYLSEFIQFSIFDYDAVDVVEFYSITLPFGSIIILVVNVIYSLIAKQGQEQSQSPTLQIHPFPEHIMWVDSSRGRIRLAEHNILFASLTDTHLEIQTCETKINVFYSLKRLSEMLQQKHEFFRLNKKCLCSRQSISSYRTLSDGRLEVVLRTGKKSVVSKNKASSLKKWLKESH